MDRSAKQFLEGVDEAEVTIGNIRPIIEKVDDDVDIAGVGVEIASRRGTEELKPRDAKLPTDCSNLGQILRYERNPLAPPVETSG